MSDEATKPCKRCETPFVPKTTWQAFCTPKCRDTHHNARRRDRRQVAAESVKG